MIVLFISLLMLQSCFADNKQCRKKFGRNYESLDIVADACKYTKSCLKCTKGHEMQLDQYCVHKSDSQARLSLNEDGDACYDQYGANYTTIYQGACFFNRCYLCLNKDEILGIGNDGKPKCMPPSDTAVPTPQSKRRRRRSGIATQAPAVVQQQSSTTVAPTTSAAPNNVAPSRSASAPPHYPPPPYPYPQPPQHQYSYPPRSLYPPPHYGYSPQLQGGLLSNPMLLLLLSGELGGGSSDNTFSKLIALSQFGNLGGHGLQGIPPSSLALSGIGGFGGHDPASLALTGYIPPSSGIDPSSLFLQRYLRNH